MRRSVSTIATTPVKGSRAVAVGGFVELLD
jgi:hypothetical protein